ncbi:gustatory receptor for bitter taste 66a [Halyomorpha halys]|uniref:gustatory receptor for bitter taste 66a n=1 Tax=Halyomorpha halys TaxID=286706 RepID=UPI000D0C8237|nr:gustatory receptor for bitter taste 66a-like isoform X1 [Halyomorpha halys]
MNSHMGVDDLSVLRPKAPDNDNNYEHPYCLTCRLFQLTNRSWDNILFKIAYFLPTWMMFSSIMVFSSLCNLIGDSFVLTSNALLQRCRGTAELEFLLQTHYVLTTAAESVSVCFGIQNLLFFTSTFFIFTSRVYIVLSGGSIFSVLVAVFFYPSMCWNIVYICNETKRKAKMFTEALYHCALFGKQHLLAKNTKVPFHFATIKEVEFSACGFFILDFPLICSLTGAATNYLLILFQFSTSEQNTTALQHATTSANNK